MLSIINTNNVFAEEINNEDKPIDITIKKKFQIQENEVTEKSSYTEKQIALFLLIASSKIEKEKFQEAIDILKKINQESDLSDEVNALLLQSYFGISFQYIKDKNIYETEKNLKLAKKYLSLIKEKTSEVKKIESAINEILEKLPIAKLEVLFKEKKYKEGVNEAEELLKKYPNNPDVYEYLGMNKFHVGYQKEGIELVKKSISLSTTKYREYYNLACLYSLSNNKKLAIETLKKALKLNSKYRKDIIKDEDFNNIKNSKEFKEILK